MTTQGSRMRTGIDRLVPRRLLDGDPDGRRRARLLVASILFSEMASLFGFAEYQTLGRVDRAWFSLGVSVPLLVILAVFRKTDSLAFAGHALLSLIAGAIWWSSQIAADGPTVALAVCVLGLSAAHIIGPVAGAIWTAIALTLGATNALQLSDPQLSTLAWTTTILAGLFGASGIAIETQRRQAFVAVQGENDRLRSLGESAFQWVLETRGNRIDYVSPEIEEDSASRRAKCSGAASPASSTRRTWPASPQR